MDVIAQWHSIVKTRNVAALDTLLAEDVTFHSPVVHTPQKGRAITKMYLTAALTVFANDTFHYVREVAGAEFCVLEFVTNISGTIVNGVDMIAWNQAGEISDFKVMVRPLRAIQLIHQLMAAQLPAR